MALTQMHAGLRWPPPLAGPAGCACAGHACPRAMRLRAETEALAGETVQAVLCTWAALRQCMRELALAMLLAPLPTGLHAVHPVATCSAGLHAGAGVDADANAVTNSLRKSELLQASVHGAMQRANAGLVR